MDKQTLKDELVSKMEQIDGLIGDYAKMASQGLPGFTSVQEGMKRLIEAKYWSFNAVAFLNEQIEQDSKKEPAPAAPAETPAPTPAPADAVPAAEGSNGQEVPSVPAEPSQAS